MSTAHQDTIEREIVLDAPAEAVFLALTQKDRLLAWFPQKIEGEFEVGGTVLFVFRDGDSEDRCSVYSPRIAISLIAGFRVQ